MNEVFLDEAAKVLLKNNIEIGIKAGDYYPDFWIRDALISSLGMIVSEDKKLMELARNSIDTTSKFQKWTGQIPNKISPDGKRVCFGEGGCVDSSLWYPVAVLNYFKATNDLNFLKLHHKKINKAVTWTLCLDQNSDWLIETNDGAGWSDVLVHSGRVLCNNVLLYKALRDADEINKILGKEENFGWIAEHLKENINLFFWPKQDNLERIREEYNFSRVDADFETVLSSTRGEPNHYLADLGFRKFDPRFDALSNLLAVLFDVADKKKKNRILNFIEKENLDKPYPLKIYHPSISYNEPFRNFYFRWSELPYLQEPGNYHNGGIWPFVGGFYIAVLKKEGRPFQSKFEKLVESCELGNWRFSEWLNSKGEPMGSANQSWSAAILLYAYYI